MKADLVPTHRVFAKLQAGAFFKDADRASDLTLFQSLMPLAPRFGAFAFLKEVNDV